MNPIVLTEDQILVLTYIRNNGIVTPSDRPAGLDAKRYNTAVFELIDGGFVTAEPHSLGDYELRLSPRAQIYDKIFPGFQLDDHTRKAFAIRGALHIAAYALAAVILLLAIIL